MQILAWGCRHAHQAVACRTRRQRHTAAQSRACTAHHDANLAGQRESGELAIVHTLLVQVANVDLHAGVVLSCNQLVRPRTVGREKGRRQSRRKS